MAAVGGSIESIDISGRNFAVAADAEVNRKLGGKENEVLPNGNGTARLVQTNVNWSLDGATIVIDDSRADQEFIQDLTDAKSFYPIAITYASGVVYQGTGQIVGETQFSNTSVTASVNFMGEGKLTQQ